MSPRTRRGSAGFTLLEVLISSVILSFLLIIGISMSRTALASADQSVAIDSSATKLDAALDRMRAQFVATGRSTLQSIPTGKVAPEAMVDGAIYDNIQFRRVTGISMGAPLYFPPVAAPPMRFYMGTYNSSPALLFDSGAGSTVLIPDGATATFVKNGDQVVVTLSCPATKTHSAAALATAFRLLVP